MTGNVERYTSTSKNNKERLITISCQKGNCNQLYRSLVQDTNFFDVILFHIKYSDDTP